MRRAGYGGMMVNSEYIDRIDQQMINKLMRYIKRIYYSLNDRDIEDGVFEGLLKVVKNIDQYGPSISAFESWVFTVVKNRVHEIVRRNNQTVNRWIELDDTNDSGYEENESDRLLIGEAFNVIQKLSARDRLMVKLELDGFKYEEIAKILNIPMNTLKSRLFRARQKIRSLRAA